MPKTNKSLTILLLLLSQTVLAISTGLFALYYLKRDHILPSMYVDAQYVGDMTGEQAVNEIKNYYETLAENDELAIEWDGGEYGIKLKDVNAVIDYEMTIDEVMKVNNNGGFGELITGQFAPKDRKKVIYPVVKLDEQKLREKIEELSILVDRPPEDADLFVENRTLKKVPEKAGAELNVKNTYIKLKNHFGKYLLSPLKLDSGAGGEITKVMPQTILDEYKEIDSVISEFSTEIKYLEMEEKIIEAAAAINGTKIRGRGAEEFSLYNCLKKYGLDENQFYNEYSQVASTIYVALLKTGISLEGIKRQPNDTQVDYAQPGLDVNFNGKDCDFKFKNTLSNPIILLAKVEDGELVICVGGSKKDAVVQRDIRVREIQRFEPSVYSEVCYDLKPGEKKVVSYGREGIEVEVLRITERDGAETEEILYKNKYDAVAAFVQVGSAHSFKLSTK